MILVVENRVTVYGDEAGSSLATVSAAGNRPGHDRALLVIAPRLPTGETLDRSAGGDAHFVTGPPRMRQPISTGHPSFKFYQILVWRVQEASFVVRGQGERW